MLTISETLSTWERDDDSYIKRATGPRREAPGRCPACGCDILDRPFFGDATCGKPECRDQAVRR